MPMARVSFTVIKIRTYQVDNFHSFGKNPLTPSVDLIELKRWEFDSQSHRSIQDLNPQVRWIELGGLSFSATTEYFLLCGVGVNRIFRVCGLANATTLFHFWNSYLVVFASLFCLTGQSADPLGVWGSDNSMQNLCYRKKLLRSLSASTRKATT